MQTEDRGNHEGQLAHALFQAHDVFLADPVAQQARRIAEPGVVNQMGAGVGLADESERATDDLRHRLFVTVSAGSLEFRIQSLFQGKIEESVDDVLAANFGDLRHTLLLQMPVGRRRGFD